MAIMLLVHDGKNFANDHNAFAEAFFPGFAAYGKSITVRNLLDTPPASPTTKIDGCLEKRDQALSGHR